MTLFIENDLGVTRTEVVNISLSTTDGRITLAQTDGTMAIDRNGRCNYIQVNKNLGNLKCNIGIA